MASSKTFNRKPDYPGGDKIKKLRREKTASAIVKAIQLRLVDAGCLDKEDVTAHWNLKTKRGLKKFQQKHHLVVDGIPGPVVWKAFGWRVPPQLSGDSRYPYVWRRPGVEWPKHELMVQINKMGKIGYEKHGRRLVVVSGKRTLAQQRYLYDGWIHRRPGFNLAAYPNPNAPHIKDGGSAVDCGWEGQSGGGYVSFLVMPWARQLAKDHHCAASASGEKWHISLLKDGPWRN